MDMIWSDTGYTLYILEDLVVHAYKAKIAFDWLQPAENYTYMGVVQ